jgi:hypothetical protein
MVLWLISFVFYKPDKMEVIFCDESIESDFSLENVAVEYSDPDVLFVTFSFSGGDGYNSLRFEFYCQDDRKQNLVVDAGAEGVVMLSVVGFDIDTVVVVEEGDFIGGWIEWTNVPTGTHEISTVTNLKDIVLNTWNFCVKLENIY